VNRNRGAKYSYYWVTLANDFPSVLVELGFVTNYEDAMAMAANGHQTGIANAVADGILNYLRRG
jgi:N-acetylmuramoyl-L-alanine amidase